MNPTPSTIVADLLKQLDRKPLVYLGGKIRQSCWRHRLVKDLRGHHWNDGPLQQVDFDYLGPFFVSCDHGCYHHPNTHGNGYGCSPSLDISRKTVAKLCRKAVDGCDLLFCYIDAPDCHGTVAEIERAHVRGIRVVRSSPRLNAKKFQIQLLASALVPLKIERW